MDLSRPIASVVPSAHGPVLSVLARTDVWLSATQVSELLGAAVSRRRVVDVLAQLVQHGIVDREARGAGGVFRLNRHHLAAPAIHELATMRDRLIELIRLDVESWPERPVAACLFGSAARGDGDASSDVDVLLVRPDQCDEEAWELRVARLADRIATATGNTCQVVDPSEERFQAMITGDERLVGDLLRDELHISGRSIRDVVRGARRAEVDPR